MCSKGPLAIFWLLQVISKQYVIFVWSQIVPAWPLTQQCIALWSGVPYTKLGGYRAFLSNFTFRWLWMIPAWPLTSSMCYILVMGSSDQIWRPYACLSILTSCWSRMTPDPALCYILVRVLSIKFDCHRAFLGYPTSGWPWLTPAWPLTPTMHYTLVRGSSSQIW